jgi:hypothetical protein
MSLSQIETFKQLFMAFQPKGEQQSDVEEGIKSLNEELELGNSRMKQIRGEDAYGKKEDGSLADVREKIDGMFFAWPQLEYRWSEMSSPKVKGALETVGKTIAELKQKAASAPFVVSEGNETDATEEQLRGMVVFDAQRLEDLHTKAVEALNARASKKMGERTPYSKGELVQGWNSTTETFEYHHPDEWQRMITRQGSAKPTNETSTKMVNLKVQTGKSLFVKDKEGNIVLDENPTPLKDSGVFLQDHGNSFVPTSEFRLKWEREATAEIRKKLTEDVKSRTGEAKKGVENNCKMADKLTALLKGHPELLKKDMLFGRIVGNTDGQGQHDIDQNNPDPEVVITNIKGASDRLAKGEGKEGDANMVMQFIGCFVDGLTEVIESNMGDKTKDPVKQQFETIWPVFRDAFGLTDQDKGKLLRRVAGYKEIAGGVADTVSGKPARKGQTRNGMMPNDPNFKVEGDEDGLIRNDISGSMHSQLLAQELSESLMGGKGIKDTGESVQIIDKDVLNARARDALALTAGGKKGGKEEFIMHTAFEMINGMRAISGIPPIDEMGASHAMRLMRRGASFTDAMEAVFRPDQLPWMAKELSRVN